MLFRPLVLVPLGTLCHTLCFLLDYVFFPACGSSSWPARVYYRPRGHGTHLSKSPLMCGWVGALIETFPDARFVVMVRNHNQCMPSPLKLPEVTWRAQQPDTPHILQEPAAASAWPVTCGMHTPALI
jgi:hypothetical protein